MKIKFIFILLCLSMGFVSAQEQRQKYIGLETGITFIGNEMKDMDFIRGDIPSYTMGYSTNSLTSLTYRRFIGIKPEIFSLNNKFGIQAGFRFSQIFNSVGKSKYWTNSSDYFYWLYRQEGVNTEYLKVKEVNQTSDYLGIPIEIRYFPIKLDLFQVFIKVGAEINFLLLSKTDIVFHDDAMELYQDDMVKKVGQPNVFSSSIYGAGGIRIGKESKPSISIEACLPYLFLTSESSGLVNPIAGGGFQINLQIPIKTKAQ